MLELRRGKGNNTYKIVYKGASGLAMDGAGILWGVLSDKLDGFAVDPYFW